MVRGLILRLGRFRASWRRRVDRCRRARVRAGAYEVIQAVLGQERMHESPKTIAQYRPHVSVAYVNAPGPAQPIISALQGARPRPVTTALGSASVLTFHRDNRMYEWTATTRLPIGQGHQ